MNFSGVASLKLHELGKYKQTLAQTIAHFCLFFFLQQQLQEDVRGVTLKEAKRDITEQLGKDQEWKGRLRSM